MESRTPIKFTTRVLYLILGLVVGLQIQSCSPLPSFVTHGSNNFESQIRLWSKDYPQDLRDRWAWCYLDSVENWSTDQKLREDVRLKSVQVLTDTERQMLVPFDRQIADAVPKQKTPLRETYLAIGNGLKVTSWSPPPEMVDSRRQTTEEEAKPPPNRRRLIFRR
jgi:hypothetical protein